MTLLSKLVVVFAIMLVLSGVAWHGVTLENFRRIWRDLIERPVGSLSFRFVPEPTMAAIAAVRDGRRDAREGRPPFHWTMLRQPRQRTARLAEALDKTVRIILLGLAIDTVYKLIALPTFYPVEALLVALLLAFVPYLLIRGPVARESRARAATSRSRSGRTEPQL